MLRNLAYPIFGAIIIAIYAATAVAGYDPFATATDTRSMPPEVRSAPAGPGAAAFWYGGVHGGK